VTIGILGGGFGLYGYLPALVVGLGRRVVLPMRYREVVLGRDDVRDLDASIDWVGSDEELLREATGVIVARRPTDQLEAIVQIAASPHIERVLLEKPVAPDPARARRALDLLSKSGKAVSVGYNFRYTAWSRRLADWLQRPHACECLTIEWRFRAHHHVNELDSWKRRPAQGGGALRFFGIHLVGLLAEMGYSAASRSEISGDASWWSAELTAPGKPPCSVVVDCNCDHSVFRLYAVGSPSPPTLSIELGDPFESVPKLGRLDRRTEILVQLCKAAFVDPAGTPAWLRASLDLWDQIERQSPPTTVSIESRRGHG
jgi:predicted dehydrogenase